MFLFSCGGKDGNGAEADLYFPTEKTLADQVDSLGRSADMWTKTVAESGKNEAKTVAAKDIDWGTELAMFHDLNPNKKAYVGKFTVQTETPDSIKMTTYTSADLKLKSLVVLQNADETVKAVYGDLETSNLFYNSSYKLSLVPYKAFAIEGMQKLNFFNTQRNFSIVWLKNTPAPL